MIRHLAAIMDGNRRWALKNKLSLAAGYKEGGTRALHTIIKFCLEKNISYLSLYAFSLENCNRSPEERNVLFSVLLQETVHQKEMLQKESIAVRFVGNLQLLDGPVLKACKELEQATAHGARLTIAILLYYGGQQEILSAVHTLVSSSKITSMNSYDEVKVAFEQSLWTYPFPAPDLIIRTGGVQRLSNFLLYQCAYSELVFLDILWPDLTQDDCQKAYDFFCKTKRNFGK